MRLTKAVQFAGTELVVRELTPAEVDALYDLAAKSEASTLDNMLDVHDLNTTILARICALDPDKLAALLVNMTPSAYAPLIASAKEVNPDFFAMARLIRSRAEMLGAVGKMLDSFSATASAGSSSTATPPPVAMD